MSFNFDKQAVINYRLQRAQETLGDAHLLFEQSGSLWSVINRAYYAMFYAVLALLASIGKGASKHSGVIALFDQHFVKPGHFPKEMSKAIHKVFDLRQAVILCSGSSAPRLKEKAELLPGRGLEGNERYIKPLSFREFVLQVVSYLAEVLPSEELAVRFGRLQPVLSRCEIELEASLEEIRKAMSELLPYKRELQYLFRLYLITGGIPLVINHYLKNRYQDSQEKIDSQVAEIFMRSVLGDLSQLKRQETLAREILRALAAKYGSRYSFSTLSHELERHHLTIIDYLTLMQESFILFVLYAYDFGRMEVKDKGDKKIYFLDPFVYYSVRSYLNGREVWKVITETAEDEDRLGGVVEGVVLSHLLMHKEVPYLREGRTFLWTYYDRAGRELDAVIRLAKGYRAVEVKYQAQVDERNLRRTAPIKDYILLSRDEVGGRNNLLIAPVDIFLSLLPVSKGNV